jgi:hypothetical protein
VTTASGYVPVRLFLDEAKLPLAAGNLSLPLAALLSRLQGASPLEERWLWVAFRDLVLTHRARFPARERTRAIECLTRLGALRQEATAIRGDVLRVLGQPGTTGVPEGRVNVLLSAQRTFLGRPFGVVHPLCVTATPWRGRWRLAGEKNARDVIESFDLGARAAVDLLSRRFLPDRDGTVRLNSYSLEGSLPHLQEAVTGESLGLGVAVATLSAMLGLPIEDEWGVTGRVDASGHVYPVSADTLAVKLEAARAQGVRRVLLADLDAGLCAPGDETLKVHGVSTLEEAALLLWPEAWDTAGEHLGLTSEGEPDRREPAFVQPILPGPGCVLVSCVGGGDPYGEVRTPGEAGQEEGPLLTLARHLSPQRVYLLHTVKAPGNDFSGRAEDTRRLLPCDSVPLPLEGVADPTDFEQLVPAFKKAAAHIVAENEGSALAVNVSSGTPQMDITLQLLVRGGRLPATCFQVRKVLHVQPGESRVREVALPEV